MIGGQRFDFVSTKHQEEPAEEPTVQGRTQRERLKLLRRMLGQETSLKSQMTRDEMIGILAAGLNVTEQEVLELLRALLGVESPEPEAALKARQQEPEAPRRDHHGRRIDKPHGLKREDEGDGPRRDKQGYRRNKPHDPRKDGW